MALTAVLEFGDNNIKRYSKQYLVSDCRFVFGRPYNGFIHEGAARCERVELVVVAPGKDDLSLFAWFSSQGVCDGRVVISLSTVSTSDESDTQYLYFNEAKCFSLSECYDVDNSRRRLLKLGVMAEEIKIDDVKFKRI